MRSAHRTSERQGDVIRILLVEDDADIGARLAEVLKYSGFAVDHVVNGDEGLYLGESVPYDAVVLDLGLPHMSGIDVLKRWRAARRDFPVLVLTARNSWPDRVEGLNAGADDYVGKPYQAPEVVARVKALVRRTCGQRAQMLTHGNIVVDPDSGLVTNDGLSVDLTARELQVLTYLMRRVGKIVSQRELINHVYSASEAAEFEHDRSICWAAAQETWSQDNQDGSRARLSN